MSTRRARVAVGPTRCRRRSAPPPGASAFKPIPRSLNSAYRPAKPAPTIRQRAFGAPCSYPWWRLLVFLRGGHHAVHHGPVPWCASVTSPSESIRGRRNFASSLAGSASGDRESAGGPSSTVRRWLQHSYKSACGDHRRQPTGLLAIRGPRLAAERACAGGQRFLGARQMTSVRTSRMLLLR